MSINENPAATAIADGARDSQSGDETFEDRTSDPAIQRVFLGTRLIGRVIDRAGRWYEATKANGDSLGLYNSLNAAAHALILAARKPTR